MGCPGPGLITIVKVTIVLDVVGQEFSVFRKKNFGKECCALKEKLRNFKKNKIISM